MLSYINAPSTPSSSTPPPLTSGYQKVVKVIPLASGKIMLGSMQVSSSNLSNPADPNIFKPSPLAHLLGLPLATGQILDYTSQNHFDPKTQHDNPVTKWLGVVVDPASENFGKYSKSAFLPITAGCSIIFRTDKKALEQEHVSALLAFCKGQLGDLYEFPVRKARDPGLKAEEVVKGITKEEFRAYFERFKRDRFEEGGRMAEEWVGVECPV